NRHVWPPIGLLVDIEAAQSKSRRPRLSHLADCGPHQCQARLTLSAKTRRLISLAFLALKILARCCASRHAGTMRTSEPVKLFTPAHMRGFDHVAFTIAILAPIAEMDTVAAGGTKWSSIGKVRHPRIGRPQ